MQSRPDQTKEKRQPLSVDLLLVLASTAVEPPLAWQAILFSILVNFIINCEECVPFSFANTSCGNTFVARWHLDVHSHIARVQQFLSLENFLGTAMDTRERPRATSNKRLNA